jgi:hypothetical protein
MSKGSVCIQGREQQTTRTCTPVAHSNTNQGRQHKVAVATEAEAIDPAVEETLVGMVKVEV